MRMTTSSCLYLTISDCLPLPLLLRSHNLECRTRFLFNSTGIHGRLLRDLAPPTSATLAIASVTRTRRCLRLHNSLVSKLTASDELFGETAAVERRRIGVDGFREKFWVRGELQEIASEVVN
jgi:hypothetical protein